MRPWISLSGADDKVPVSGLLELCARYPGVSLELGVLYFPEKEGSTRYPRAAWRQELVQAGLPCAISAHLCGQQVFRDILEDSLECHQDLLRYNRLQLNINARGQVFTEQEVFRIYDHLIAHGRRLILQYHAASAQTIERYLANRGFGAREACDVLFDGSKGTGTFPETWPTPLTIRDTVLRCGYAGGIGPQTIGPAWSSICAAAAGHGQFWVDMESGIRTNNEFDLDKVHSVLDTVLAKLSQ